MGDTSKQAIFERLKHSVQLLASSGDVQLQLLPSYVCKADELALEFDQWREVALHNYGSELNADQLSALNALDEKFSWLTADSKAHWSDEAIRESSEWQAIRNLAVDALKAFGWPAEIPPSYAHEYKSPHQIRKHIEN